jgi:hypothetical protein
MTTTRHEPTACPRCGYRLDAASDLIGGATPKPGDFSVCLNCGELLRFNRKRILRICRPHELRDPGLGPKEHATLLRAQQLIRERGRFDRGRKEA